ncbi:MAG: chemotaxis protein CheW [Pseudomonadota bacterium]|uniref:Chemotaxis protein CheW n=1 Tax=Thalassovita autumnalis TaxID=2072972 RepID=A0A0P1FT11_9RHOB|nr:MULTISPECIES: chemotaxis protein CheW [Thalassovita]MEC8040907.1 chemotaxis protein CheW [Pseudomonadota bacterium]MEC8294559.1 chemotaxis protein CheW [Pseudomonadota bacterium]CUH65025.1 Chemotaxis protein CheW [Thalassovita autumnalis]CUH71139.1 Chemotaxis protein CheW [Thalassovita autumnalis]
MFDTTTTVDEVQKTYLTCGLGEEKVALPVVRVKEILDPKPVTPLPHTPDFLLGYIDLRGESILVADLRLLLARPYRENEPDTRIIVLLVNINGQEHSVGLRADRVFEVTRLDDDRLEEFAREGLLNWDNRMVAGVGRRDGEFVTVLDLDGMLSSGVISEFHDQVDTDSKEYREAG